jgi:hypothetical protein
VHDTVFLWLKDQVSTYDLAGLDVFEVGSSQSNDGGYGNSVRDLFRGHYLGVDREPGPGVDAVWDIETGFSSHMPPVILCLEVLEHTPRPWLAIANMAQGLRSQGHFLLSCRGYDQIGYAPVHMEPHDYWRFSVQGVRIMLEDNGLQILNIHSDPHPMWRGVMAHAIKP